MNRHSLPSSSKARRRFLQASAAVLAAGALPGSLLAGGPGPQKGPQKQPLLDGLLIIPAKLEPAAALSKHFPDLQPLTLEGDLVRAWRDSLADSYRQGRWLVGLSHWDECFLIRELAREAALRPLTIEQAHARVLLDTDAGLRMAAGALRARIAGEGAPDGDASMVGVPQLFAWALRATVFA